MFTLVKAEQVFVAGRGDILVITADRDLYIDDLEYFKDRYFILGDKLYRYRGTEAGRHFAGSLGKTIGILVTQLSAINLTGLELL